MLKLFTLCIKNIKNTNKLLYGEKKIIIWSVAFGTPCIFIIQPVAHLVWKTGVCHGRAAFDITFQHETILSLKTRNRPMNFAMLPKYYIGKILPIYSIMSIFAHKSCCACLLHKVF